MSERVGIMARLRRPKPPRPKPALPWECVTVSFNDAFVKRYGPTVVRFPRSGVINTDDATYLLHDVHGEIPEPEDRTPQFVEVLVPRLDSDDGPLVFHVASADRWVSVDMPALGSVLSVTALPEGDHE